MTKRWIRALLVVGGVGVAGWIGSVASHDQGTRSGLARPTQAPSSTDVAPAVAQRSSDSPAPSANPPQPVHHDVSPPLRTIPPAPPQPQRERENEERKIPGPAVSETPDPVVQSTTGRRAAPALSASFNGLGDGLVGPGGTMSVNSAPPDDNGAVGPNHYVQVVNTSLAIFNKTGTVLYGPVPTNTLWSGFGGGCQSNNDGDATVAYDRLAGRWVIQQFSVSTTPFLICVAVSTGADPTGAYYRYSYQYASFPDYPKLGVWPDAYYVTLNLFSASTDAYQGPEVCAYDRAKMLLGQAATQKCFILGTSYGSLLPADVDGPTAPPGGSPNYLLEVTTNALRLWKFHVDFATPASSTLTGPTSLSVASFSPACGSSGICVTQPSTTQKLDALSDRLMNRLAYRNFGDHESLVAAHTVVAGSSAGMRWYELRNPGGAPTVHQQGTYAPDSAYRWMGSIAMDKNGDIALGYSISSSSVRPGMRYTGRLVGDPLGVMTQGEGVMFDGVGSQTGGLNRWGDYTSLTIDPSDDCTFWYTNEYLPSTGSFNWRTRVGSFKFPSCGATGPADFSIGANPASLSVAKGSSRTSTISTALTGGAAQSIVLSASGQPAGATVGFSPSSVTSGGSSTMTVNVGSGTVAGTYPITVTGTGTSATHTTTVNLTVTAAATSDFSMSANPAAVSVAKGGTGSSTIGTAVTSGAAQSVGLSASGQPAGVTTSFNPVSVTAGGTSKLTVNVSSSAAAGTYSLTVTGTGSSVTRTTQVLLTVTAAAVGLVNGTFETGNLSGWTATGAYLPRIVTKKHGGSYGAQIGSTSPVNGNSTLTQTVLVPGGAPTLRFWYQPRCDDTIKYDQIQMQVRSTGGTTLATVLNVCAYSSRWTQVSYNMSSFAGQTVVLWFNDHDDGYAGDPTYFLVDDITLG